MSTAIKCIVVQTRNEPPLECAGEPVLTLPSELLHDAELSMLHTFKSRSCAPVSLCPPMSTQAFILQLHNVVVKMVKFENSPVAATSSSASQLTPRLLRSLSGAFGAVAAGKEKLCDVMDQRVGVDGQRQPDCAGATGKGHKPLEGVLITMHSILCTILDED